MAHETEREAFLRAVARAIATSDAHAPRANRERLKGQTGAIEGLRTTGSDVSQTDTAIPEGATNIATTEMALRRAARQDGMPMPLSEWERIKKKVQRIPARPRLFASVASTCVGGLIAAVISAATAFSSLPKNTRMPSLVAMSVVASVCLTGLVLSLVAMKRETTGIETSKEDVLEDMEEIEKRFPAPGRSDV